MENKWKTYTVQELVDEGIIEAPRDGNHGEIHPKSKDFVENGIPFIMASDLDNGIVDTKNCKFIKSEQANSLRKGFSITGDVLLSHKATIGRTAIVNNIDAEFIVLTPQVTYYRVANKEKLHNKYLKYYFDSRHFQELFTQWAGGGSTRLYLGIKGQLKLPVVLPEINTQRAIAHILGTLDDKIELNRRMNETLEQMAQALFKSWFVDFDPVIDKALAAGHPIPEPLQAKAERRKALGDKRKPLPEEIQALFPDAFVWTEEMGWVPEGWRVKKLLELFDLIGGGTPKTSNEEYWNGDIPWFSVVDAPNISDVFVIDTEKKISSLGVQNSSTKLLPTGTTIISARGTVGKCAFVDKPIAMNQSCYGIRGRSGISDIYTYYSIRHNVADLTSKGHGSVFNTITRDTFKAIAVAFGNSELTQVFEAIVRPYFNRILNNCYQKTELAKLRDTLLPKLISGELQVGEAEKIIQETPNL